MLTLRPSSDRGLADHGWLKSRHSFSFADYHDPRHMGVGTLRVINEDRIAPGTGFGTHGHRDMEILSWVLSGALAHRDSLGNGSGDAAHPSGVIRPGDLQRMSAGTGVMHSEFNHSKDEPTHFLQIWLLPARRGIAPGYAQKHFDAASRRGRLALVADPQGRDGAVSINADARLHVGSFDGAAESAELTLDPARLGYAFVARGRLAVNGRPLEAGDALTLDGETRLSVGAGEQAELLFFDLAR